MDRDAIERRDFPVGRRGYDQAAVDAHLRRVADELESMRTRPPTVPSSLSVGTSEQVRAILEAAEASAAELRADAGRQASDHVARVQEAAGSMLSRLDQLESELGSLLDALRVSGQRLDEGLERLRAQAGELGATTPAEAESAAPEEHFAAAAPAPTPEEDFAAAAPEPAPPPSSPNGPPVGDDEAGARLIALNMALSGTPREETARYLSEHFATLTDPDALLDDVYERAQR